MKATVIVDNIGNDKIKGEWGLSIFIEYEDKKLILDTGASDLFLKNAEKLGININDADYAVLSHAHYDHANGMKYFFEANKKAKFYLNAASGENCYVKELFITRYIGIPKGILSEYKDRISLSEGITEIYRGITLVPHSTDGLSKIGKREKMYIRNENVWLPDDFAHEQSLVFETEKGLVIFNSCSHGGAVNIINEVSDAFPDKKVYALIGGFHLYNKSKKTVRKLAQLIKDTGIEKIYTGHCTGKRAYRIMKKELGDKLGQLKVNLIMEF